MSHPPGEPYSGSPEPGQPPNHGFPPPPGQSPAGPPPPYGPPGAGFPPPGAPAPQGGDGPGYPPPGDYQPGGYQPGAAGPGGYPPPAGPPPGFGPGVPVPPPRKKSNVLKIILITFGVLLLLCIGGGVAAFFAFKDDVGNAVKATQTRVVAPETVAGRPKVTQPALQAAADQMVAGMKQSLPGATSTVGAFYGDPAAQDLIMIAGASGLIANPAKTLDDSIASVGTSGLALTNVQSIDPGPLGGVAKCGDTSTAGVAMGVCLWADQGSHGLIGMYFKSADEAKAEFLKIRSEVEQVS